MNRKLWVFYVKPAISTQLCFAKTFEHLLQCRTKTKLQHLESGHEMELLLSDQLPAPLTPNVPEYSSHGGI